MTLDLDPDELARCVGCGLCLPHCPTYRVTGEELRSPRGRIRLMREVEWYGGTVDDPVVDAMETCIQCRGCEPACPSAVPFGRLMEGTREHLAREAGTVAWWQRLGLRTLGVAPLVRAGAVVASRVPALRRRAGLRVQPLRRPPLRATPRSRGGDDVVLVTGCVMDALQREVHLATQRVLEAAGFRVAFAAGGCCGALAGHAGLARTASRQARALTDRIAAAGPADAPVAVDAAGCGAQLKELGRVAGTPLAHEIEARVVDVHELLADRVDRLPPARHPLGPVVVQDPCHLRHVQHAHGAVRVVLGRYAELVELDDDGLCCGAGGAFSLTQPALATDVRARKVEAIARTGAPVVASANPGCALHLAAGGVAVRHPVELVADALFGPGEPATP